MVKSPHAAQRISELMLDISARINESVDLIKSDCPGEEHAAYQRAAAKAVALLQQEILNPLYAEHPELRPKGWNPAPVAPVGEARSLGGIIQPV